MILGVGIDMEETARIGESIEKFGAKFLEKIYTEAEVKFCDGKANAVERYTARFAAKEATFKALQASWDEGVSWRDFEVIAQPGGAPRMELSGGAARIAEGKGVKRIHLSFSHTKHYVTAVAVLED